MAIAAYMRVSTSDQDVGPQREEIERWLEAQGHDLADVKWFVDVESGAKFERPQLGELNNAVFYGHVKTIVIWKIDRLGRDIRQGIETLCRWLDYRARVVSVTQQMDLGGPIGKIVASVLLGVAEIELSNIRERQAAGIALAKKAGVYKGRKPGATKVKAEKAREMAARGLKSMEIMAALGIKSRTTLAKYLRDG